MAVQYIASTNPTLGGSTLKHEGRRQTGRRSVYAGCRWSCPRVIIILFSPFSPVCGCGALPQPHSNSSATAGRQAGRTARSSETQAGKKPPMHYTRAAAPGVCARVSDRLVSRWQHQLGRFGGLGRASRVHRTSVRDHRIGVSPHVPRLRDQRGGHRKRPSDESSSTKEANLGFWIDDEAKTVTLADGTRLMVTRLDGNWLSASRGDISYEFNRRNGILSYAASTTKGRVTTVIIGSGRCESNPAPPR
jgi:hypothetical protein